MNQNTDNHFLTPVEERLKHFFMKDRSRFASPCNIEDMRDILDDAFSLNSESAAPISEQVHEHSFIPEHLDCSFVRHMRYMPAFWHKHEFFELLFVMEGSCVNHTPDGEFTLQGGDICIFAPDTVHAVRAFTDDDIIWNIVIRKSTFEQSFMGLLVEDDIMSDFFRRAFYNTTDIPYLLFHTGEDTQLRSLVEQAQDEYYGKKRFKRPSLNSYLSLFFITLFRNHEQHLDVPTIHLHSEKDSLVFILQYIQEHFDTVTLKELSCFFNYSERQLQRIIEKATGLTFVELIQHRKMAKAEKLLAYSSMPIEQVCGEAGYQSPSSFRKIFMKYHGMSPKEYRKSQQCHSAENITDRNMKQ